MEILSDLKEFLMNPAVGVPVILVLVIVMFWDKIAPAFQTVKKQAAKKRSRKPVRQITEEEIMHEEKKYAVAEPVIKQSTLGMDYDNFAELKRREQEVELHAADALEKADFKAISHLRQRAVESGDEKLIALVKKVFVCFYDVHAGNYNEAE